MAVARRAVGSVGQTRRTGRLTPAVYAALSGVLIVGVLAVAYGTAAPQLGVAEFAPAARESLDAPPTTADPSGAGAARPGRRATTTTTMASSTTTPSSSGSGSIPPTTRVGRARSCYGSPPRQTPDPMSPPCMATIFEGDNGGATATGVTGTDIKVAIPISPPSGDNVYAPLFEYFNRHYELYGRRLVPVYTGSMNANTPVAARAAATTIADQQVFATLPSYLWQVPFFSELARRKVVVVSTYGGFLLEDRTVLDPLHPYVWSVLPSLEDMSRTMVDLACTSLRGRVARFAGAGLNQQTRKFGIIATGVTTPAWTGPLQHGLAECTGVEPNVAAFTETTPADARRAALQSFKDAGVTTIICLCHANYVLTVASDARPMAYGPEWLPMTHTVVDDYFGNAFAAGSAEYTQLIELSPNEKLLPMQTRPSFGALMEVAPNLPNPTTSHYTAQNLYQQLSVLAAGIQAAGPQLTPDAFGQGLMATQFSNAGAGQAPYFQPSVGFGPGDHSFYSDYSLAWWNPTLTPYDAGAPAGGGSWCYLGRGTRFRAGTFPADVTDSLFLPDAPCR